jgi:hypothetical protein
MSGVGQERLKGAPLHFRDRSQSHAGEMPTECGWRWGFPTARQMGVNRRVPLGEVGVIVE